MRSVASLGGTDAAVQARQAIRELQVRLQAMEDLVGKVIRGGSIKVKVRDLQDTNTTDLADGVILQYDADTQEYVATAAGSLSGVDAETLDGIDSLGFVQTDPAAGVNQTVTVPINTVTRFTPSSSTFYHPLVEIDNGCLKIGNTPLAAPTWPPGAPQDGEFLIASRRITSGTGGSTLNIINDLGVVTRIDLSPVVRQSATPGVSDGYQLWIDTSINPAELNFLGTTGGGSTAWRPIPVVQADWSSTPVTDGTYLLWIATGTTVPSGNDQLMVLLGGSWVWTGLSG